jgi:PadR family transcriptional regulator, regulatory protein PadR
MKAGRVDVVPGTLELLVLKTLSGAEALHGFGVLAWLRRATEGELQVEEGALYPALHRMEQRGWIQGEWRISEKGRRAKYYALTSGGHRQLAIQEAAWTRYLEVWRRIVLAAGS